MREGGREGGRGGCCPGAAAAPPVPREAPARAVLPRPPRFAPESAVPGGLFNRGSCELAPFVNVPPLPARIVKNNLLSTYKLVE